MKKVLQRSTFVGFSAAIAIVMSFGCVSQQTPGGLDLCLDPGDPCLSDGECCGDADCDAGSCCVNVGRGCSEDSDCCSNNCDGSSGKCVPEVA